MSGELGVELEALEKKRDAALKRNEELRRELDEAEERKKRIADLAGRDLDGKPMPMAPLLCALVGVVLANTSLFSAFILWLTGFRETTWAALYIVSSVVAVPLIIQSKKLGAGGMARTGLRRVAIALLIAAVALGFAALVKGPKYGAVGDRTDHQNHPSDAPLTLNAV